MDAATAAGGSAGKRTQHSYAKTGWTAAEYERVCPVLEPESQRMFVEVLKASLEHSKDIAAFLQDFSPEDKAEWLKLSTQPFKTIFQPWSFEILFMVAVQRSARFSELEEYLGISSRTLSTKLRALTKEGFLKRIVHDEQPVRIEYTCSKHGLITVQLATPLFTHLNNTALYKVAPQHVEKAGGMIPPYANGTRGNESVPAQKGTKGEETNTGKREVG